jgi:hypothetical protein
MLRPVVAFSQRLGREPNDFNPFKRLGYTIVLQFKAKTSAIKAALFAQKAASGQA